ncbi:hypothetical protein D3C77_202660 [compost metagenome]
MDRSITSIIKMISFNQAISLAIGISIGLGDFPSWRCVTHAYKSRVDQLANNAHGGILMTTAIDLFAGLGGWSTGARAAGVQVLWAANHWPKAVK